MRKQIQNVAQTCSGTSRTTDRPQSGFTIVELLVVVSIIALLAAILIPAVFNAVTAATNASMKMEVNQLSMALEKYKQEMGEYPPDFSITGKTEKDTIDLKRDAINGHLARKFRLRRTNGTYTQGGDDLTNDEIALLNPTNALYFWLRGFSEDPQRPLTGAGNRDAFYEFGSVGTPSVDYLDNNRNGSTDEDAEREPEINRYDPETGTVDPRVVYKTPAIATIISERDSFNRPLLYYRGVTTHPQLRNEAGEPKAAYDDAVDWAVKANAGVTGPAIPGLERPFPSPYWSSSLTRRVDPTKPAGGANLERERIDPEKFQLIMAGRDGIYGVGGHPDASSPESSNDYGVYPEGSMTTDDLDNITNFGQASTLEDTQ